MVKLKLEDFSNQMPRANIRKHYDDGQDWGQEEKEVTEDEMFGWYDQFNGHVFEQTVGNSEREEGLVWCNTGSHKIVGHDWMNNSNQNVHNYFLKSL